MTATASKPPTNPTPWERLHHIEQILDENHTYFAEMDIDKYLAVIDKDYVDVANRTQLIDDPINYRSRNTAAGLKLLEIKISARKKERARYEDTKATVPVCC